MRAQAHRGGIGLTVESTLAAFEKALEVGVTTLELDIQITSDGREVALAEWSLDAVGWLAGLPADLSARHGVATPLLLTASRV